MSTRPRIWSYSMLNTYLSCPRMCYHKYVVRDLPKQPQTEAMKWGNTAHEAFERRINSGMQLIPELSSWENFVSQLMPHKPTAEHKLGVTALGGPERFYGHHCWGVGVVDALIISGENALLLDWKTGKRREDPFELEIFGLLVKVHWPQVTKITGQYVWLKENTLGALHDLSDFRKTWDTIQRLDREMDKLNAVGGVWPEKENGLCREWCDVIECQFNGRKAR